LVYFAAEVFEMFLDSTGYKEEFLFLLTGLFLLPQYNPPIAGANRQTGSLF
jgi:hypothetical protein